MIKNGKTSKAKFSEEEIQDIIQSYLNGESSVQIGKRFGISHKPILKLLHEKGVYVDPSAKRFHRQYALNEDYFDNIDTQDKAYIFGFLMADGNNNPDKQTISMALQEEDKYILEEMRIKIGSEKPLDFLDYSNKHDFGYTYKNQWRLNLFSKKFCEVLAEKGMVPNKSFCLQFPTCIPDKLLSHFVRGYFDGNGHIGLSGGKSLSTSIVSTLSFCNTLSNILKNKLNIESKINESRNHNGITHDIRISKYKDAIVFLDWIYKDADIFLTRKNIKYHTYLTNNLLSA